MSAQLCCCCCSQPIGELALPCVYVTRKKFFVSGESNNFNLHTARCSLLNKRLQFNRFKTVNFVRITRLQYRLIPHKRTSQWWITVPAYNSPCALVFKVIMTYQSHIFCQQLLLHKLVISRYNQSYAVTVIQRQCSSIQGMIEQIDSLHSWADVTERNVT